MSDRKYRQRGYQDQDREPERREPARRPQAPKPQEREGPRSPKMMAYGQKVKCAACGAVVDANVTSGSSCPKCKADLHTCRMCSFFDPGARFECRKPITARILNKSGRNECELFSARTVIERETSSSGPTSSFGPKSSSGPSDPRQAFANLFKK
jgi:hypothetical protein